MMKRMNIPIFIPHLGCPHQCVFCNQEKISGVSQKMDEQKVRQLIESSLETTGKRQVEIAFFGGSFTGIPRRLQERYLSIAKEYVEKYDLAGIRFSTRPDYISSGIMQFLKAYPIVAIELGVQSLDGEVLEASKRGHSLESVDRAVRLIKEADIELGLQVMVGLPEDTPKKFKATIQKIIDYKPKTLRIYPTVIFEDTPLASLYREKIYKPISVQEAVVMVAEVMPDIVKNNIRIIRMGLQANETLSKGDFLAGPYHPAFKELVLDEWVYRQICDGMKKNHLDQGKGQTWEMSPALYQRLVGHKKNNLYRIRQEYLRHGMKSIQWEKNSQYVNQHQLRIKSEDGKVDVLFINF